MPKTLHNALTDGAIRSAVTANPGKLLRLVDGRGLRLVVTPNGRRRWELRYQPGNGAKELAIELGEHPATSIVAARRLAEEARVTARSTGKPLRRPETFEGALVRYVAAKRKGDWTEAYAADSERRLRENAVPLLGGRLVGEIRRADIRDVLDPIVARGSLVQARRIRSLLEQMFTWLLARDEIESNPADRSLLTMLPKAATVHHEAPATADLPTIYRALVGYPSPIVALALRWTVLNAARTGETLHATFDEVDRRAQTWTIPAARMKAGLEHVVPLSDEALGVFDAAVALRRKGCSLIFATPHAAKPLSNNAMLYALQRTLGFSFTTHGLARAAFSTWAHETRAAENDTIEFALAHVNQDRVAAAYRRGTMIEERRALMRKWAELLRGK